MFQIQTVSGKRRLMLEGKKVTVSSFSWVPPFSPHNTCFCWNLTVLPACRVESPRTLSWPNNRVAGPCVNVTLSSPSCLPSPFQSPLVFYFHKLGMKLRWAENTWFQLFYSWKGKSFRPKAKTFFKYTSCLLVWDMPIIQNTCFVETFFFPFHLTELCLVLHFKSSNIYWVSTVYKTRD